MTSKCENAELAYLAGYFDGEGSIGIYKLRRANHATRGYQWNLQAQLGTCDREVVDAFHRRFGGHVYTYKKAARRNVRQWVVSGPAAKAALGELLPYLRAKKSQAFEALKYPLGTQGGHFSQENDDIRTTLGARIRALKMVAA